jgi:hypothetical protein
MEAMMRDVLGLLARTASLIIASMIMVCWVPGLPVAQAQSEAPPAGPTAVRFLPNPTTLGEGWMMLPPQGVVDLSTEVFREGATGYYGGPDGARAVVMVFIVTDARIAIRQAWEEASDTYDTYRHRLNSDEQRAQLLATLAPPDGCEEVKRSEGIDEQFGFPTAITLCAGSGNEIILAVVSGNDAATQGYEASDALAARAIQANSRG